MRNNDDFVVDANAVEHEGCRQHGCTGGQQQAGRQPGTCQRDLLVWPILFHDRPSADL